MDLLLLADPSVDKIESYLNSGSTYIARLNNQIVGVLVLQVIEKDLIEIKNIAVSPSHQGKGIGRSLLHFASQTAGQKGYRRLRIATGNSSIGQLNLYKASGFVEVEKISNYFIEQYPEPIYENGIQCVDQIILEKPL